MALFPFIKYLEFFVVNKPKNDDPRFQNTNFLGTQQKLTYFNIHSARNVHDIRKNFIKRPTNAVWFHDIILFYSDHRHILVTDVAIFRVASARTYNFILQHPPTCFGH